MRISHQYRFVYVAITKTGSESVRLLLDPFSCIKSEANGEFRHHVPLGELAETFEKKGWAWDEYHKFTVVRHPLNRLFSLHKYYHHNAASPPTEYVRKYQFAWYQNCVAYSRQFKTFESAVVDGNLMAGLPSMMSFVEDNNGTNMLSSFAKLESLNDDLRKIFELIPISAQFSSVPVMNASPGDMPSVSREIADMVNEEYFCDFKQFDYSFC